MSTLTISLPDSISDQVRALAQRAGVTVDQLMASAASEKISALLSSDYLEREASLASREDFERVMSKVPDVPPELGDELA
jgi:hypothetical protein